MTRDAPKGETQDSAKHGPRILYFAPKECWPPSTGAQLRNHYLSRELARHARVTYLGFTDLGFTDKSGDKRPTPDAALRAANESCYERVVTVPLEGGYTPVKLARGMVGRTPLPILNYTTPAMRKTLARLLDENDFDAVQVEGIHLVAYLPIIRAARSRPVALCDWHNVESELMRRYGAQMAGAPRRFYARLTAHRLAQLERRIMRAFDAHLTVSDRDRAQLLQLAPAAPVFTIENGVNVEYFSDKFSGEEAAGSSAAPRHRVVFVGSMDYHANIDAAAHFAREVWPGIHRQRPDLVFTIVGRNPPAEIGALSERPGIEVTGRVQDVRPYFREALATVVPLRIGGGSRLKILEAMAVGVPVVSTRLGAEGLAANDGEHILLADTPEAFRRALLEVCGDEAARQKLVDAARTLVKTRYDWPAIGAVLLDVHRQLLARRADMANPARSV